MKYFISILSFLFIISACAQDRVDKAYEEKEDYLKELLSENGIESFNINVLIIGLKKERDLQIWIKHKDSLKYNLLINYEFCSFSGELGPKRKEGDLQIPEGFYYISYFNPWSSFHLSLKVSYPNQSDKILGEK